MKTIKKQLSLLLVATLILISGCIESNEDYQTPDQIQVNVCNELMESLKNKDVDGVKSLLCSRFKETHKKLSEEIEGIFVFLEGDIVSYDDPSSSGCGGSSTAEDGWVKKYAMPRVNNIKTSDGRIYKITCEYCFVDKEEPDLLGITYIHIIQISEKGEALKEYTIDAELDYK